MPPVASMLKRETYLQKIRPFMGKDIIKVLTGIRRCGKSVMLELLKAELRGQGVGEDQILSVNFDAKENAHLRDDTALHEYVNPRLQANGGKTYLFFDEIQWVPQWETCVNSLFLKPNVDIYLTGSNAQLLAGELATHIAGRYVKFEIFPFSFAEFFALHNKAAPADGEQPRKLFDDYFLFGGMPFLSHLEKDYEVAMQYLGDIYQTIILKDVIQRAKVSDTELLERIVLYVLANIGRTFSANSISKYLKSEQRTAAPETVINYLKACENAYLFHRVPRNDLVGKKLLAINEKFYISDHGIREAVYKNNRRDPELVMENIVYMELRRRGYNVTVGKVGNAEIDFVAEKQNEPVFIQVAYYLAGKETIEREFGALEKINSNYPKYVISMDDLDRSANGIKHLNIRDFLLGKTL